jgi:hypothetical protein
MSLKLLENILFKETWKAEQKLKDLKITFSIAESFKILFANLAVTFHLLLGNNIIK